MLSKTRSPSPSKIGGKVLIRAKGGPAQIVAVAAGAAIVSVGVGLGYGVVQALFCLTRRCWSRVEGRCRRAGISANLHFDKSPGHDSLLRAFILILPVGGGGKLAAQVPDRAVPDSPLAVSGVPCRAPMRRSNQRQKRARTEATVIHAGAEGRHIRRRAELPGSH